MSSVGDFKRRPPKNAVTRRAVKKYEPKVVENPKCILFLKGSSINEVANDAMTDLSAITKPYNKKLKKKNGFTPFDGYQHLEFLGFKNDCSLFCFGSHSKKRPNNLTFGRLFDFHILDMVEAGIVAADRLDMSRASEVEAGSLGGKPFFVFEGSEFSSNPVFIRLKNFLVDFFAGGNDTEIDLDGCDRVLFFSLRSINGEDACVAPATDCFGKNKPTEKGNTILCMRHYAVQKPSFAAGYSKKIQNISLYDIGPNFDLELRRIQFADPQAFRAACRVPREILAKMRSTQANVSTDEMANLTGQLHVGSQNTDTLNLRRFKAHRGRARQLAGSPGVGEQEDGGNEEVRTSKRRRKSEIQSYETNIETDI
ncbi:unnamed protein product [Phytomonas sp. EM1]|nr:unnamed protein product [Phytomonas sp. EM1]|eukprot:CCW64075.1 unnamed protein product [Phytomonas sp. isolate EM1]